MTSAFLFFVTDINSNHPLLDRRKNNAKSYNTRQFQISRYKLSLQAGSSFWDSHSSVAIWLFALARDWVYEWRALRNG